MKNTVLITGTSSGFGRATAHHFARQGWNVVATMRKTADAGDLVGVPGVLVARLDVTEPASVDAAVAEATARFGALDVVVNNAGYGLFGVFEGTTREQARAQFDVNVFGVMDVVRAVLPGMRARRRGVIVNVSSGAGVFTLPLLSMYSASKFALEGFSEALSYELASQGVVVKILEPGGVVSTEFGRRSADEAARTAPPADYAPFLEGAERVFAGLRADRALATSEDVARAIFDAATDGTDRLRYVATRDIEPLVRLRRETSEDEYVATMRARFQPR